MQTAPEEPQGIPFARLKRMVDYSVDLTAEAREQAERARDYFDGFQLTVAETTVLRNRKQPVMIDNVIRPKIDAIIGLEQQGRVDPRALPRNPADEEAADLATKALAYVEETARLDTKRSAVAYNLAIEGYGGVEVCVKQGRNGYDPDILRLRWEEIFYDPHSREEDFSDAAFVGVQKWMDLDEAVAFAARFVPEMPEAELEAMLETCLHNAGDGETYEDRPYSQQKGAWGDKKKKRVRLAYMYYRHRGIWWLTLLGGSTTIYNKPSPYIDEDGKPCCAIILQSTYVDRENRRYGLVKDWMYLQDGINKRQSKLLHMLNSRQTMSHVGAIRAPAGKDPIAHVKRELASPDGHVEYDQDPSTSVPGFQIIPQTDQIAGQFQLLQESRNAIATRGPNPALLGQMGSSASGRAIMAQQQAGYAELAPFYNALKEFTIRVYRAIWNRIRQYWTEPRWIRITDEKEKLEFIGINQPIVPGLPQFGVQNAIAELDVDIIVDMSPEYASLQHEQFEAILQLASVAAAQGQPIPWQTIFKMSSLKNKAEILAEIEGPPEAKEQAQAVAQQQQAKAEQMQEAAFQVEMQAERARAAKDEAAAQKAQIEAARLAATPIEQPQGQAFGPLDAAKVEKTRAETMAVMSGAEVERFEATSRAEIAQAKLLADIRARTMADNGWQGA